MTPAPHPTRRDAAPSAAGAQTALAAGAGRLLGAVDRLCAAGYLAFSAWVVRDLWLRAETHGWPVLMFALPVVASTVLLAPSVFGRRGEVLRPAWPPLCRRMKSLRSYRTAHLSSGAGPPVARQVPRGIPGPPQEF